MKSVIFQIYLSIYFFRVCLHMMQKVKSYQSHRSKSCKNCILSKRRLIRSFKMNHNLFDLLLVIDNWIKLYTNSFGFPIHFDLFLRLRQLQNSVPETGIFKYFVSANQDRKLAWLHHRIFSMILRAFKILNTSIIIL